jgi:hypothetical protein
MLDAITKGLASLQAMLPGLPLTEDQAARIRRNLDESEWRINGARAVLEPPAEETGTPEGEPSL